MHVLSATGTAIDSKARKLGVTGLSQTLLPGNRHFNQSAVTITTQPRFQVGLCTSGQHDIIGRDWTALPNR